MGLRITALSEGLNLQLVQAEQLHLEVATLKAAGS